MRSAAGRLRAGDLEDGEWRMAGSLKAGEYRFDHPATVGEVYDRLRRGDVYTVTVVIPEGFNIFDIARRWQRRGWIRGRTFWRPSGSIRS